MDPCAGLGFRVAYEEPSMKPINVYLSRGPSIQVEYNWAESVSIGTPFGLYSGGAIDYQYRLELG